MAAPTNAANVKKALANSEPSTHGTSRTLGSWYPQLVEADVRTLDHGTSEGDSTMVRTYREIAIEQMLRTVEEAMSRAIAGGETYRRQ